MIMENRSRRLREPPRWGARERAAVAAVIACAVLALGALGVYALTSGGRARRDCIHVTFASSVGAANLDACGAQARRLCAAGELPALAADLRAACARAGLVFRAPR